MRASSGFLDPPNTALKLRIAKQHDIVLPVDEDGNVEPLDESPTGRALERVVFTLWDDVQKEYKFCLKNTATPVLKLEGMADAAKTMLAQGAHGGAHSELVGACGRARSELGGAPRAWFVRPLGAGIFNFIILNLYI